MTELLDRALAAARQLPADVQDDLARIVLQLAGADDAPVLPLSPDERAAIAASNTEKPVARPPERQRRRDRPRRAAR